LTAVRISQ